VINASRFHFGYRLQAMAAYLINNFGDAPVDDFLCCEVARAAHANFARLYQGEIKVAQPLPNISHEAPMFVRQRTEKRSEIACFYQNIG
jgi:hypothetical protein